MTSGPFLSFDALGVAKVLRTESLSVPPYQRAYSWRSVEETASDEQDDGRAPVAEYWADLTKSFSEGSPYFLGSIVLSEFGADSARNAVLDGQQRLATTCILLAAIRDKYSEKGENNYANSIAQEYIGKFDRDAGADRPNLILNTEDRDYFERVIMNGERGVDPVGESQALIEQAYEYLRVQVETFCDSAGARRKDSLDAFVKFLDEQAQVISISVASEADAFLIFETLNDRGADLTIADLLKNFLFSKAGGRIDEVKQNWILTLQNLDTPKIGNSRFNLFARHYMSSRQGIVRERELYSKIRSTVDSPASAVSFSTDLKKNSRLYYALLTVASDVWTEYDRATKEAVEVLVDLNLERYRPMLLAALAHFDKAEVQRLMRIMVGWSIRALAAGKLGGGVSEAAFCGVAKEITDGTIRSVEQVIANPQIDSLIPSDSVFEAAFSEWKVTKGSLARYMLRALELQQRGEAEPELVVNPNVEHVNLEHILPKNATVADWPQVPPDDQRLYVTRLGNMALLKRDENGRIGNKSWTIKQPILMQSSLELTVDASKYASWDTTSIDQRQQDFARLAVVLWPRLPV